MQDPVSEIAGVVKGLVSARNASEQKACLQRYFAPDASFDHPLCSVASGPNSRDNGVLPIYQWLRCMFTPDIETHQIGFDEKANKLFLDVSQRLTPNVLVVNKLWAPIVRLIVVLQLQRGADGKFYVKRQEDFYEPQVLPFGLLPLLGPVTSAVKHVIGFNCAILTGITQLTIGYWRPGRDPISAKRK
ncbi:uncharacterized protein PFL1_00146 [Pseudozyma flocculosa PF-1]|uniref:SigF-like NTF2-like domain-containing protein n=1 Tax=Pseudozyma flocculosa TaxID=84751 RepID=A0A5C3ETI0_9BASI|nr:uncharacterized protein PFL1_00146 [Pseudozyma flocculosa PF-1]EPQ31947.1 hypothetical protein PFL1_00146 [Pseudozyma flocculosa PF-1]SPO35140.1 uncharacterized protein PSFLO_00611 [Pseudozyma flocculosa]